MQTRGRVVLVRLRNTPGLRAVLCLPLIVVGVLAALSLHWAWVLLALFALCAILEGAGKYPALLLGCAIWLYLVAFVASFGPDWVLVGAVTLASVLLGGPLWVIGFDWGAQRAARLAAKGKAVREWEWVYTGRDFAREHALYGKSAGIWLVMLALVAILAFYWTVWLGRGDVFSPLVAGVSTLIYLLTLWALWRMWPVAYPLTFLCLVPGFPFTIPLVVYWADGVRPNLIYRHRFERLVPQGVS